MPSVPEERWSHLQPLRSSSSLVQEHAAMSEERGEGSWGEGKGGIGKGGTGGGGEWQRSHILAVNVVNFDFVTSSYVSPQLGKEIHRARLAVSP